MVEMRDLAGELLATTQTSATDGSFSLTLPESAGFRSYIVEIVVRGDEDALMVCDAPAGCDGTAFGNTFPIGADVDLRAYVSDLDDGDIANVNLNLLTTLAAAETASGLPDPINLADATLTGSLPFSVDLAFTDLLIGDAFGFMDAYLIDFDPTADTLDAARLSLLSGGAMEAFYSNGYSVGNGLDAFVNDFTARGGALLLREGTPTPTITMAEILGATYKRRGLESDNAKAALARILLEAQQASISPEGATTTASPQPNADDAPLDQAKAFIDDLQTAIAAVEDQTRRDDLDGYLERVDAASAVIGDDVEDGIDLLATIFERLRSDYETNGSSTSGAAFFEDGFGYNSQNNGTAKTYEIDQFFGGFTIRMEFVFDYASASTTDENGEETTLDGFASAEGTLTTPRTRLSIGEDSELRVVGGSTVSFEFEDTPEFGDFEYVSETSVEADLIEADLAATIEQLSGGDLRLDGRFSGSVADLAASNTFEERLQQFGSYFGAEFRNQSLGLTSLDLAFSGEGRFEGSNFQIALGLFTSEDGFRLDTGTPKTARPSPSSFTVETDGSVTLRDFGELGGTYDVIPASQGIAEYEAAVAAFYFQDEASTNTGVFTILLVGSDEIVLATALNSAEPVLKLSFPPDASDPDGRNQTIYTQQSQIRTFFRSGSTTAVLPPHLSRTTSTTSRVSRTAPS